MSCRRQVCVEGWGGGRGGADGEGAGRAMGCKPFMLHRTTKKCCRRNLHHVGLTSATAMHCAGCPSASCSLTRPLVY
jgi:hypothetical protein